MMLHVETTRPACPPAAPATTKVLSRRAFVSKVKEAARRHRETLEGFGILRVGMRDVGDAQLQRALAAESASMPAVCELDDGTWALLVCEDEDGSKLNALADRLAARTTDYARAAGLPKTMTVTAGAVSGRAAKVDALALLELAEQTFSLAFEQACASCVLH